MAVDPYRHLAPRGHHRFTGLPGDPRPGQDGVKGQSAEFGQFLLVVRARMGAEAAGLLSTSTACRSPRGTQREESPACRRQHRRGQQLDAMEREQAGSVAQPHAIVQVAGSGINGSALVCGSCTTPSTNQPIY